MEALFLCVFLLVEGGEAFVEFVFRVFEDVAVGGVFFEDLVEAAGGEDVAFLAFLVAASNGELCVVDAYLGLGEGGTWRELLRVRILARASWPRVLGVRGGSYNMPSSKSRLSSGVVFCSLICLIYRSSSAILS